MNYENSNNRIGETGDAESLELLQEKYRDMLERDSLTGVYNRRGFYSYAYKLIKSDARRHVICCINIDKFKVINDLFGTAAGDKLLIYLADNLSRKMNGRGVIARLTADNFAICYPWREDIYDVISGDVYDFLKEYPLPAQIVAKCGFYCIHDNEIPVSIMCDRANMAILEIKGNFNKRYFVYDDSIRKKILQEQEVLNEMRPALADRQFVVYYQPKFNMESGRVVGSEALVRWIHPDKGMISPGIFIPIFEKNGFISNLDRYVWEAVCRDTRRWIDAGMSVVPTSINVSRAELYDKDLAQVLTGLCEKYEIPMHLIQLEITESAYTDNPEQLISVISQLKEMGFTILMDDFGSGYSSLNTLKDVPVDVLKLDLKFLYNMDKNKKANYILKSIVQMAMRLELDVIAEGVEEPIQSEFLRSIGCVNAQGFLYSRPIPRTEFEAYLSDPEKVSTGEGDFRHSIVDMDDVTASFHREDELHWYRSAMTLLHARLYEYDIENDIMVLYDAHTEEASGEFGKVEITNFSDRMISANIVHHDDTHAVVELIRNLDTTPFDLRIRNLMYDKGYRWFRQTGNVRRAEDGTPAAIVGVLQDVSEEKGENAILATLERFDEEGSYREIFEALMPYVARCHAADGMLMYMPRSKRRGDTKCFLWDNEQGFIEMNDSESIRQIDEQMKSLEFGQNRISLIGVGDVGIENDTVRRWCLATGVEVMANFRTEINRDYAFGVSFMYKEEKTMTEDSRRRCAEICKCISSCVSKKIMDAEEKASSQLYMSAFKNSQMNLWEWDIETGALFRSSSVVETDNLGEWVENVPYSFIDAGLIHPDYVDSYIESYRRLAEGKDATVMVKRLYPDGNYRWLRIVYTVTRDENGKPVKAVGFGENVNQIYRDQMKIRERIRMERESVQGKESWFKADLTENRLVDWASKLKITGEVEYQRTVDLMADELILPSSIDLFKNFASRENLIREYRYGHQCLFSCYQYYGNKEKTEVRLREVNIDMSEENGHIFAFAYISEISDKAHYEEYLGGFGEWDRASGWNYDLWMYEAKPFSKMIRGIVENEPEKNGMMMVVDMDRFQLISKTFGEEYASEVLKNIVAIIKVNIPRNALFGRLLQDRFAIFVPEYTSKRDMLLLSNRLQKSIYASFTVGRETYVLSPSIGISYTEYFNGNYDALMNSAIGEMLAAKSVGL